MARVATVEAMRFMVDCLTAAGASPDAAEQQARMMLRADMYDHPGQGISKLEYYVHDITTGACQPNNQPEIIKETASTALVDAKNVLGATASHFAMDIAIQKAKETGVGWVVVKGSNHNGMAGYWAQKAADAGLIGMAFSNTPPVMVPTRSKEAALGSNPMAVVAPGPCRQSFYLDMSTTTVDLEKIDTYRDESLPIPAGWALGANGEPTQNAFTAYCSRRLLPLGGSEICSGYKGYGLSAMVELFCGISSGSRYGHHIRKWSLQDDSGSPAELSHCFVALDPGCFAPGFGYRLVDSIQYWRDLEPVEKDKPVLAPGDLEKIAAAKVEKNCTLNYSKKQIQASLALADKLDVKPMNCKCCSE